jgi:hypothetical protein
LNMRDFTSPDLKLLSSAAGNDSLDTPEQDNNRKHTTVNR